MAELNRRNLNKRDGEKNSRPTPDFPAGTEELKIYLQTKLTLADQLRIVKESLGTLGQANAEKQIEGLMARLAEDRFTLAVLGQFKRGKSSLMNAIIGKEILPTGVLPVTSAITILKYGPEEKLVIRRNQSPFPEEFPVSALPDFVTEKGNPGNQKRVQTAFLEMPEPFLRRGIEFADTPGVGSAETANTKTTLDFLPQCDAALFITSVDSPLSETELDFLKTIRQYVDKIFFIINKIDLISDDELKEILGFMKKILNKETGKENLKVFPLTARYALESKEKDIVSYRDKSGLESLKSELGSFLTNERFTTFLTAITRKTLQILNETEAGFFEDLVVFQEKEGTTDLPETVSNDRLKAASTLKNARENLESFYKKINQQVPGGKEKIGVPMLTSNKLQISTPTHISSVKNETTYIAADLQTRECPVCHHLTETSFDFFSKWQYQIGKDESVREIFAKELGFCPLHTWQLISLCSPRGASIGFARLSEEISERLQKIHYSFSSVYTLDDSIHNSDNCRVCKNLVQVEIDYLHQLATFLQSDDGLTQYDRSQGVCVHHLGMLLKLVNGNNIKSFLLSHTSEKFAEDAEEMRSFTLKQDALRRFLQNRNEDDAWLRTVARLAGNRHLSTPWVEESEI